MRHSKKYIVYLKLKFSLGPVFLFVKSHNTNDISFPFFFSSRKFLLHTVNCWNLLIILHRQPRQPSNSSDLPPWPLPWRALLLFILRNSPYLLYKRMLLLKEVIKRTWHQLTLQLDPGQAEDATPPLSLKCVFSHCSCTSSYFKEAALRE